MYMTPDQRVRRALLAAAQESSILFSSIVAHDISDETAARRAMQELETSSKVATASALGSLAGTPVNFMSMGMADPGKEGSHAVLYLHLKGSEDHIEFLRAFGGALNPKILYPSPFTGKEVREMMVEQ